MSAPKRFWKNVDVVEAEQGFTVTLDQREIKTPAKAALVVPTRALAGAIAEEWRGQGERVDPRTMPQMRYANSVIDGIAANREAVVETVAAYGGSDLLCYRAPHPDALIARQAERWDPLLDWSRDALSAPLVMTEGVIHVAQPTKSLEVLGESVAAHSDFELAGLHDLVAISGSLVLGLAVSKGRLTASEAFALSRLDDDWQIEQWGVDEDASVIAAKKAAEFTEAARLLDLVRE